MLIRSIYPLQFQSFLPCPKISCNKTTKEYNKPVNPYPDPTVWICVGLVLIRENLYLGLILQLSFGVGDGMLRGENQPRAGKNMFSLLNWSSMMNNYVHT